MILLTAAQLALDNSFQKPQQLAENLQLFWGMRLIQRHLLRVSLSACLLHACLAGQYRHVQLEELEDILLKHRRMQRKIQFDHVQCVYTNGRGDVCQSTLHTGQCLLLEGLQVGRVHLRQDNLQKQLEAVTHSWLCICVQVSGVGHHRLKVLEGEIPVASEDLAKTINCITTLGCVVLLELKQENLLGRDKMSKVTPDVNTHAWWDSCQMQTPISLNCQAQTGNSLRLYLFQVQ